MWNRDRVWNRYVKNIIAADKPTAIFLAAYIKRVDINKEYVSSVEIFDLQQYTVISKAAKVRGVLRDKLNKPFIFIACKN
jgi:hypothetical protein